MLRKADIPGYECQRTETENISLSTDTVWKDPEGRRRVAANKGTVSIPKMYVDIPAISEYRNEFILTLASN